MRERERERTYMFQGVVTLRQGNISILFHKNCLLLWREREERGEREREREKEEEEEEEESEKHHWK